MGQPPRISAAPKERGPDSHDMCNLERSCYRDVVAVPAKAAR